MRITAQRADAAFEVHVRLTLEQGDVACLPYTLREIERQLNGPDAAGFLCAVLLGNKGPRPGTIAPASVTTPLEGLGELRKRLIADFNNEPAKPRVKPKPAPGSFPEIDLGPPAEDK